MTVNISNFSEPVAVNRLRSTRRDFAQHFIFGEMLIFSTIYLSNRLTSLGGLNFFNWVIIEYCGNHSNNVWTANHLETLWGHATRLAS